MNEVEFYNTIDKVGEATFRDRGSRFIAYAFPVASTDDCRKNLEQLKKDHAKATHHCFAYRLGVTKDVFRVSDDGEPSGTAGRPILGQIDSRELTNVQVVVVRYFGGTLLGVPGLINAYKSSASMALQVTPVTQKAIEEIYQLDFDYTIVNDVMTLIKQINCSIIEQRMNLFCQLKIGIPRSKLTEALYRFGDIRSLELKKEK